MTDLMAILESQNERLRTCDCVGWQKSYPSIDKLMVMGWTHGMNYTGDTFRFCPWCGKAFGDDRPEAHALVEAARAFVTWYDRTYRLEYVIEDEAAHVRNIMAKLAPFDPPAPPTTLVDSSGRYEYEVKRD